MEYKQFVMFVICIFLASAIFIINTSPKPAPSPTDNARQYAAENTLAVASVVCLAQHKPNATCLVDKTDNSLLLLSCPSNYTTGQTTCKEIKGRMPK